MTDKEFTPGERYQLPRLAWDTLRRAMGAGAVLVGEPDFTRGRRFKGKDEDGAQEWEIWSMTGRKISIHIAPFQAVAVSVSSEPDPDRPEPLPEAEKMMKVYEAIDKALRNLQTPQKCIKPECNNLVAPLGIKKLPAGTFKNYRGTGACQKGHNNYHCLRCDKPHSYVSQIGKDHYESVESI